MNADDTNNASSAQGGKKQIDEGSGGAVGNSSNTMPATAGSS